MEHEITPEMVDRWNHPERMFQMLAKRPPTKCQFCKKPLTEHNNDECFEERIKALHDEVASLKKRVAFWNLAWYEGREIIGKLMMHGMATSTTIEEK